MVCIAMHFSDITSVFFNSSVDCFYKLYTEMHNNAHRVIQIQVQVYL